MSSRTSPFSPTRRSILIGGAAALGSFPMLARGAMADVWPSRPVKFVVPFAAGGTTDILGRLIAAHASTEFSQQFIVENKPGAGGNIAADYVAKSDPDGYTFIVGTPGTHSINKFVQKNMPYDPINDIAPVGIIAKIPNLCSVSTALPIKTVAELIAYAKAKPGELLYGTPGLGSTAHVSTELFKSMTGTDMIHVPYKGSAPALTDLVAGRIHLMIDNLPVALPFAQAGSIRAIAISTTTRSAAIPDLPTVAEAGVPGYEASAWFTIGAPAKTAPDIIARLNASMNKYLTSTAGKERFAQLGADPAAGTPQDMQKWVLAETEKWGKVAQFAGIKPE